ncbi:hypothetical protein BC829DRAFT_384809 [Chytridium lagenaria]|nr:hypothetical protein BC829DRAFT_384809 [Chytridium lagenaria]
MDASVKDSAFYQLFKLFYFDVTRDKIADLEKDGLVPAAVRVSRNAVPSFSSFDLKEESRSKAGQSQEEYATRLTLGAGRYYIAVYGNANPLVMTQFTLMIRKMPISLTLASFASLWRAVLSASTIPVDALQCGKDLDGKPLYAARVRMPDGSIRLGHVGRHLKGAVVVVASGFEVLIQTPGLRFVEQLQEGVPPNAVPGGCEIDGRVLCVARATVHGKSVNMLSKMVTPGEVETGVVPFEVLVYQTANSGANPFMLPQQNHHHHHRRLHLSPDAPEAITNSFFFLLT